MGRSNKGLTRRKGSHLKHSKAAKPKQASKPKPSKPRSQPKPVEQKEHKAVDAAAVAPAASERDRFAPPVATPVLRAGIETHAVRPPADSEGVSEAMHRALAERLPVKLVPAAAVSREQRRAERRGCKQAQTQFARNAYLASVRKGRPGSGEQPGPRLAHCAMSL
jgi:hypothetical protein